MFRVPRWLGCISFVVLLAAVAGQPARAGDGGGRRAPAKSVGAPANTAKKLPMPVAATPMAVSRAFPPAAVPGLTPASGAGLILALDPLTGDRVRPTPGQIQELERGFEALWDRNAVSIEVVLPDGSRGSYVGRRFAKALIAHIGPSGKIEWGCGPLGSQVPSRYLVAQEE